MSQGWVVLKFGGTSVSSIKKWQTIFKILKAGLERNKKQFVVCSALSGISNSLENLIANAKLRIPQKELDSIFENHNKLACDMGFKNAEKILEVEYSSLKRLAMGISLLGSSSPQINAQIMGLGEIMATKLGAAFLLQEGLSVGWLDARDYLVGEGPYESALCQVAIDEQVKSTLQKAQKDVFITQGFIARNKAGESVILGRGGSDTSAAYFGVILGAEKVEIWTDVPGLFTSNPHEISGALLLPELDYDEAQELASSGAKVLHPRCIEPLRQEKIPLEIRWTEHPKFQGTRISAVAMNENPDLKAVICKKGVYLISISSTGMWQKIGFLADIFARFKEYGLSVDLVSTSQNNVTVTLDPLLRPLQGEILESLIANLQMFCQAQCIGPCATISLIGRGAKAIIYERNPLGELLQEKRVYMISHAASDINYSFVIDEEDADRVCQNLHSDFFSGAISKKIFGPCWEALHHSDFSKEKVATSWWQKISNELCKIAEKSSPAYVYHKETVLDRVLSLKKIKALDQIFYALKANYHAEILKTIRQNSLGFECVSLEEVFYLKKLFPDLAGEKIIFTPSFTRVEDFGEAFKLKCYVTVDNVWLLKEHPSIFANQKILLRVDPETPRGHHKHVKTAGKQSKFGITLADLEILPELLKKIKTTVIGMHVHTGSGVLAAENWKENALFLVRAAKHFPSVLILNIGGGLGIVDRPGQKPLDLHLLNRFLQEIKTAYPQYQLWLEPGRFIVAEAGVLLSKVTQLKNKGLKCFVGIESGMNSLIRPALYGAHHPVINLTRINEKAEICADVVGPICESGDVLGFDRTLPSTREGDVILIANAGAYGHVMSSYYNLRKPAEEIWLP
jgi:bifunctional diaminopimelate decarboxylase / aspartate kinase